MNKNLAFTRKKWFTFFGSGILPVENLKSLVLVASILIFGLTLFTNQYFHGGVFGKLHNKSVKPIVEISNIQHKGSELTFQLFRVEGADVYGSFLIGIEILNEDKKVVSSMDQKQLAEFPVGKIHNHYVAKIKPGKHSLIIPLGAKADLTIDLGDVELKKNYSLKLIDISGAEWTAMIN